MYITDRKKKIRKQSNRADSNNTTCDKSPINFYSVEFNNCQLVTISDQTSWPTRTAIKFNPLE